jgi:hypothetical protein
MRPIARPSSLVLLLGLAAGCSPGGDSAATATSSGGGEDAAGGSGSQGGGGPGSGGDAPAGPAGPAVTTGSGGAASSTGQGGEGAAPPCAAGTVICEGTTRKVCDGNGGFSEEEACDPGVCIAGVGCTVCAPGSGTCNGETSTVCNADGSGFDTYVCDPEQGVTCNAGTGHCEGACSPELLGTSYIGCEYYPTVTANSQLQNTIISGLGTYALAVANTSNEAANLKVHRGAELVTNTSLAPNSVQIVTLPWVNELKNATSSTVVADGAYRLRTNRPVTVYQYSPIEYSTPNGNTYTNDASLLLPTNAWTGTYRVASRNAWRTLSGFYAITASEDATTVTLSPSATGASIKAGGGVAANGAGTITLNQGDVLQVLTTSNGSDNQSVDLTGTGIVADKPIQVIGGHDCTNVPWNIPYCDHLEESLPPVETLSTEYIITPPQRASGGADTHYVRVIATQPATALTFDPPLSGAATMLANPGDWTELPATAADFVITASQPVLVAQYMQGQGDSGVPGDPAMALSVATEQYRQQYLFHAPTNYLSNFVNVTAPTSAVITLDGAQVSGFVPIGASGFSVARVQLSNAGDGNHVITGNQAFGISVYGYGDDTSYWYPGGLDLDKVATN